MALARLATDAELDRIFDGALKVLETAGFLYQSPALRDTLVVAGCLDGPGDRVRIPRAMVQTMLEPRLASPALGPDSLARRQGPYRVGIGSQLAQFYLDPETSRRLPADRALLAEVTRFGHVWQDPEPVGPVLLARDVPPPVEPIEAVITLAQHTDRVAAGYVHYADQVPYLAEMGRILTGDAQRFIGICVFAVTPLRLDRRACELLQALMPRGASVWIGTQPASGASSPVTVAGTVVLAVAEILAGWVACHVLAPEALPGAGVCSGVLDMRTADVSYCAPEAMLQDLLCVEVFRHRAGGRCHVAGCASYTDAKWPGSQRAFEQAFEALTIYYHTGDGPHSGSGLLESGKTFSPVQLMLDQEFGEYLWRFAGGVGVSDEALALESILDITDGIGESHMTSDHTLEHWRGLYSPHLLDRGCWQDDTREARGEARLLARAWEQYREVRDQYQPTHVSPEHMRALEQVAEDAWRQLLGVSRPA